MSNKGLSKLVEECGELIQVAAKKIAYIDTDEHPDGAGILSLRMSDEMADVLAICRFVREKFNLDMEEMHVRAERKYQTYLNWDSDPNS